MTAPPRFEDGASFFGEHREFLQTEGVRKELNRLTARFDVIFGRNKHIFAGARVLDIGAHDGRWSMAALNFGAAHAHGIEGDVRYVDEANALFARRAVPPERYRFTAGHVPDALTGLGPGTYDVILCLGFYYHTPDHVRVFEALDRLRPACILLDTAVSKWPLKPFVQYRATSVAGRGNAVVEEARGEAVVVGKPNGRFLRLLADTYGWRLVELNWKDGSITDWTALESYRNRGRRTYVLTRK
jgi:hypothetical protein